MSYEIVSGAAGGGETLWIGKARLVSGEALSRGDMVCIKADGLVYKADSNDSTLRPAVGMCEQDCDSGDNVDIVDVGWITGATGLTPGDFLWLSETPGAVTQTKPTYTYAQVVGIALTATMWRLKIELGYVGGFYS